MSAGADDRPMVGSIRSDDEHRDLLAYHLKRIREQRAAVEDKKGPVATARAALKSEHNELANRFSEARVDLGREYTREYIEVELLKGGERKINAQVEFETRRARDKHACGQAVYGMQPTLFPGDETPTFTRDEMAWEAEGYQRGLRGDMDEIVDGDPPEFHQAIMRGFEQGQKVTSERVQRAMEAKAKLAEPNPDAEPIPLAPVESNIVDLRAAERAAVRRAKESLDKMTGDEPATSEEAPA